MSSPNTQLSLINEWGACPPDGYRYVDPEDGFVAHAWTYVDWVQIQKNHLAANSRSIPPDLGESMQHQLCLTLPPGWCKYDDDSRPRPSTSLEWNDVMRGLKTFGRWILTGRPYVNQAEADRRALVCTRCYLNVDVSGCSGCQKLVEDVVVDKHSKYDSSLRACAVCKCFLRAKIHFHLSDLEKDEDSRLQEMYPDFCWLKKGGENYKPLDKPGVQAENQ